MATVGLIRIKPKTTEHPEYQKGLDVLMAEGADAEKIKAYKSAFQGTEEHAEMIKSFQADDVKLEGMISVPKNNYVITPENHLVILLPQRIDFAIGLEPDEYMIVAEQEQEDEE
ncbi:hypothetical protein [Vibrio phage PhiImVa-1]|nr:hypothetical protein [Vibrio phage PhiImVa-1]